MEVASGRGAEQRRALPEASHVTRTSAASTWTTVPSSLLRKAPLRQWALRKTELAVARTTSPGKYGVISFAAERKGRVGRW